MGSFEAKISDVFPGRKRIVSFLADAQSDEEGTEKIEKKDRTELFIIEQGA